MTDRARRRVRLVVLAAAVSAVLAVACADESPAAELRELKRLTTPAGAVSGSASPTGTHAWTWDTSAGQSWASYATWVQAQVPESYGVRFTTPTALTFRRVLDGDVYELRMRPVSGGTSVTVTATFTAAPF